MIDELKVLIVEGKTDKEAIQKVINEPVEILCTYGTIGVEQLDDMIEQHQLDAREVYVLVDADKAGEKLRKQLKRELPLAQHLFVDRVYREVAAMPLDSLAALMAQANIAIRLN
ncbi:toprim domain-containing protein [Bacillaceae bacterium SIJ1]|uniref:toprim domain-containing protein n=1 Tax=Litoribacterium kuwaitense TaxID=1398745 RepID=UPI0013ED5829|nr:toprim domain-containing protein [Litoribacterium kuwaitense]NGP46340.1 toprim domain-containing protein [Litoribacterium kuwaitense]